MIRPKAVIAAWLSGGRKGPSTWKAPGELEVRSIQPDSFAEGIGNRHPF